MLPSEEETLAPQDVQPFLPTPTQVGRALERTHTSSVDLHNVLQAPSNRSNSNNSSTGGARRFRTHLIGVFHHSTIDGLSRKEFWDEILRCLLTLNNAKRYAEYASSIKALAGPVRAAAQPLSQHQQQTVDVEGPSLQPGINHQQSLSVTSTATPTPLPSPMHRWRRGSSNTSGSSTSSNSVYFRRGSAGSTSSSWLPLGELEQGRGLLESTSAHNWCYLRRLSAVSAGSVDSAAGYPGDENLKKKQREMDLLFPPKTLLPPALNDTFRLSRCISVLRPLMAPGDSFYVKMYKLERQLLRNLRNPFASYFPAKRFRASGAEYTIYKIEAARVAAATPVAANSLQESSATASPEGHRQHDMSPPRAAPEECDSIDYSSFTGVVTLRLSETLTAGLLTACRERKMTLNGLITTAAAVALSRMLWRRQRVMQQHSLLADLSCVAAAATAAHEWSQQHHQPSMWDSMASPKEQQEQEGPFLLQPQDGATPQRVAQGDDGETGGLPPFLASARAAAAQEAAAANIERTQLSANWGNLFSSISSKGASKGTQQTLSPSAHDSSPPLPGGGMQRLPSIQELLRMPQPDSSSSNSKRGTKEALPRSAVSRSNASGLTGRWSLSHIREMLQQLTLWSPVSGEGPPGKVNRQFVKHKGPVYIYTLQAVSGRRWLDSWLQGERQPEAHARGRKKLPRDDRMFEEFLLQHFTSSLKSHKCSRYVAAVAATPVPASANASNATSHAQPPRHPASLPWVSGSNTSSGSLSGGNISTRSVSSGHCRHRSPNDVNAARPQATEAFCNSTAGQQQRHCPTAAAAPAATVDGMELRQRYWKPWAPREPVQSPAAVSYSSSRCFSTPGGLTETAGHSSVSTTSSLPGGQASTISADSLEDTEKAATTQPTKSKSSASCSRRLQAHTRTISSRISRGLRMITQWIWGSSSTSSTMQESQKQQLQQRQLPFGLGSFALLMPLRLRVPVECDEGADAVWALGKACTDSVQEFVSLANPSLGTANFQLIAAFVEEMRGKLKVLRVFRDDAFARPSVFLMSNGGAWGGGPVNKFAAEIHEQLRSVTERHRRLLQRMLQQHSLLQHRAIKRQMLHQLPAQIHGGAGATDAALKNRRQCSGRKAARNAKSSARADNPPSTSPAAAASARRNSVTRGASVDLLMSPVAASCREQQPLLQQQQQQLGAEAMRTPEGPLGNWERLLPPLEPFDVWIDSSWSVVAQHDTGLNYFAHNCVTIGGRMNWSLQYHSNLTSREIAALYASYILEVLEEAHEQHVQKQMEQHQQLHQQPPPLSASSGIGCTTSTPLETMQE